jgi:hypothetical protein
VGPTCWHGCLHKGTRRLSGLSDLDPTIEIGVTD